MSIKYRVMVASVVMISVTAMSAQAQIKPSRTAGTPVVKEIPLEVVLKAAQERTESREFIRAEKANDVATMRRLLEGTKVSVSEPPRALWKLCLPPWGWVWGYQLVQTQYGSQWQYGLICLRGVKKSEFKNPTN